MKRDAAPSRPPADIHKVTAFVTRGEGRNQELLVFRHPTAGIQLPAGTVEQGEAIETAVLREVHEETGLTEVEFVAKLAVVNGLSEPDERMITRRVPLRAEPAETAPCVAVPILRGRIVSELGRGLTVRQMRDEAGDIVAASYAKIGYDLFDIRDSHDWVLVTITLGWVPLDAITSHVERHLFHLRATAPTPDRWIHDGDVPGCEPHWTPLVPNVGLVRGQDVWLRRVIDQLQGET